MDGVLPINKPPGMTSHDVVDKVRRILKAGKVGHTGTLDPAASGLLLICIGKATKLTSLLQNLDKTYQGRMIFGLTTTSFNGEGEVVEEKDASSLTRDELEGVFARFRGEITQIPPMFSAIRWKGKRLYKLAREGLEVERSPRKVQIYELRLLDLIPDRHPQAEFELRCSKGTYIRSLCHEIGKSLGYGAYQASLCRTKIGPFDLKEAKKLKDLEGVKKEKVEEIIRCLREALPHLPLLKVKKGAEKMIKWGRPLYLSHLKNLPVELEKGDRVRLCSQEGELLAIAISLQKGTHFSKDRTGFKYLRVLI